jgi:hypothetical protein
MISAPVVTYEIIDRVHVTVELVIRENEHYH